MEGKANAKALGYGELEEREREHHGCRAVSEGEWAGDEGREGLGVNCCLALWAVVRTLL